MEGQDQVPAEAPQAPKTPASISWSVYIWSTGILFILFVAFSVGLYWWYGQNEMPSLVSSPESGGTRTSLGADLYQKAVNPLDEALPEAGTAVVNPLEDAYQNPFQ